MKKSIVGNWVAEKDGIETKKSEDTVKEFFKDFVILYSVWSVFEYIDEAGTKRFVASCGWNENTEKNAKEIAKLHNKNKNNK